jgi:phosphate-selective porin OprO and OprP
MPKVRILAVAFGVLLLAPTAATAQSNQTDEEDNGGVFRWRNRPSIQLGEHIRLDLRLKLQWDWRRFDPEIGEDTYDFRAHRGGVNGEITEHVEFQIERDFNKDGRWRDVFVNWRTFRQAEVMAGKFKVPFGREQLTSSTDIDFAFRSLVSTTIPPARDRGVMVHGRFLQRGFTYEIGAFEGDGDNGRLEEAQFTRRAAEPQGLGRSVAARMTATPMRPLGDAFETLRIGAAYGVVDVPEGLNSFRGESAWGTKEFVEPVYVKGRRHRYGAELTYMPGPVGFAAEWMQAREGRKNQGLGDVDLSDFVTTGWYASATWLVTGEDKEDFNGPRRPIVTEGIGAIELAARYDKLQFESADKVGEAFANPRAENYLMNSDEVWTVGVNWFPNRWVRLVINGIHEHFADLERTPKLGTTDFWSGVFRLQLVF